MLRWNRAYNLTRITEPEAMVRLHLFDSLAIRPYLAGPRVLDIGSGAGLPGIPLAITTPDLAFTLIDSSAKRVRFLRQVKLELGLDNVEAVHARAETYRPQEPFATVTARAVAAVGELAALAAPLCAGGGKLLLMRGRRPQGEELALPPGLRLRAVHPLQVPGVEAERHLVELECKP
jgi:16S rRNA (guanine527-N7)-methyltransferase